MDMSPTTMMGTSSTTMVIMVVPMKVVRRGATDTGRRHSRRSANVRMLEGRHSVVQRRFRPFIPSTTHGTMRPWLTREDHAKAAYAVGETLDLLSIGRTSLYPAIKRGDPRTILSPR
jgi:hypothetical protein